jgi:microcystin-dependent protein
MSRKVFASDDILEADEVNNLIMTPSGVISAFGGATAPTGYLLCDGSAVSTTTYNQLFAVIGYTYGGSGGSFSLPNLKGRIPVGRDSTIASFDTVGETGGERTVTLTIEEMPSHNHSTLIIAKAFTSGLDGLAGGTVNNNNQTYVSSNTGGGQAHNNLQPYLVVNYIIKT